MNPNEPVKRALAALRAPQRLIPKRRATGARRSSGALRSGQMSVGRFSKLSPLQQGAWRALGFNPKHTKLERGRLGFNNAARPAGTDARKQAGQKAAAKRRQLYGTGKRSKYGKTDPGDWMARAGFGKKR